MKWLYCSLFAASLIGLPLFGDNEKKPTQKTTKEELTLQPAFDADLFRRDKQVYSFDVVFLFWRAQEGALDYATRMNEDAWGPTECFAQGKFKKATFDGDPGFRATFRFFRAERYWEFWTEYTRMTSRGEEKIHKPSPDKHFITGTWPQIFSNPMASAESRIHLNYNVADVFITRVFFPNPHLRLRVAAGGSVAWINQFWKVQYFDWMGFETKILNRWKFIGGGLKVGTIFDWYWFHHIYMTGGAYFGGLVGSYKNRAVQRTNFSPSPDFNPSIPVRNGHFSDVRPTFVGQFFLGPSYQKNHANSRTEFFIGYEMATWLNLQEIWRSTSGTPTESKETRINTSALCLQGLTARATVDF